MTQQEHPTHTDARLLAMCMVIVETLRGRIIGLQEAFPPGVMEAQLNSFLNPSDVHVIDQATSELGAHLFQIIGSLPGPRDEGEGTCEAS